MEGADSARELPADEARARTGMPLRDGTTSKLFPGAAIDSVGSIGGLLP